MIIAGTWPPDPHEVARQLRERMARAGVVGEPRSGEDPMGTRPTVEESAADPRVQEHESAN
jgi:hypothetical protein